MSRTSDVARPKPMAPLSNANCSVADCNGPAAAEAEVVILNTCTVTASADQDARAAIRRIHRENPDARILVTGCYAQRAPEELSALPGVSLVVGNSHKHELASYVRPLNGDSNFVSLAHISASNRTTDESQDYCHHEAAGCPTHPRFSDEWGAASTAGNRVSNFVPLAQINARAETNIIVGDIFAHTELMAAPVFEAGSFDKTRPNLKVQDGCNNRCSFCIIPSVRGRSRSLKLDASPPRSRCTGRQRLSRNCSVGHQPGPLGT